MKIIQYYKRNRQGELILTCRIVDDNLITIRKYSGKKAEVKAEKFLAGSQTAKKAISDNYNTMGIDINPYNMDSPKMKLKHLTSDINLSGYPNFHITGNIQGMRKKYYGNGALLVRSGSYIYNVTYSPDIYYKHAI